MINFKEELHLVITKVILRCIQMTTLYHLFSLIEISHLLEAKLFVCK